MSPWSSALAEPRPSAASAQRGMVSRWTEDGGRLVELIRRFWTEEAGQDLIEYTLLMAFLTLASAALFIGAGSSVSKVWSISNSTLSTAAVKASS